MERMALHIVGRSRQVQAEALEQHHRDIDAPTAGGDAVAEPVKERFVQPLEVELGLAVPRRARPRAWPWLRCHTAVDVHHRQWAPELLPTPEPDEVVAVLFEKFEVGAVVERLRRVGTVGTETQAVLEIVVYVVWAPVRKTSFASVPSSPRTA